MQDTTLSKHQYIQSFLVQITQHANYNNIFHAFIEANSFMIS